MPKTVPIHLVWSDPFDPLAPTEQAQLAQAGLLVGVVRTMDELQAELAQERAAVLVLGLSADVARNELSQIIFDSTAQETPLPTPPTANCWRRLEANSLRQPRAKALSSNKPMPKTASCWATKPVVTPMSASSNACVASSSAKPPSWAAYTVMSRAR